MSSGFEWLEYLEQDALIDRRTGLASALAFQRRMAELCDRLDTSLPLTVLRAEVDLFDELGENAGPTGGNRVVRHVGQAFAACTGERDVAAAVAADGFALILPNADIRVATGCAIELQQAVRERTFDRVTITVGSATLTREPSSAADPEAAALVRAVAISRLLCARAEEALGRAQRRGEEELEAVDALDPDGG